MEQREVDNMLLSMIQKHFPSLPLSDEHTDWGKWLGFARAVYEAGRASPASVPAVTDGMALAFHRALTDGSIGQPEVDEIKTGLRAALAAAPTPPVEDRWQPIETAPKDGSYVLLAGKRREDIASGYWLQSAYAGNGAWIWPFVHKYPTHWMPLHKAPAMQEDKP